MMDLPTVQVHASVHLVQHRYLSTNTFKATPLLLPIHLPVVSRIGESIAPEYLIKMWMIGHLDSKSEYENREKS